jgi:tetratricopeptide (TPR) repeat protein
MAPPDHRPCAKGGGQYLLTAEVVDPADGTTLRAEESQARAQEDILTAVQKLAMQVRRDVVETLSAFPRSAPPVEQVTTSSLRALHLYSEAAGLMINKGSEAREESMQFLRQALKEDPDFASAHIMLAWLLSNSTAPSNEHFERAFALSDSVSEHERLFIVGSYYQVKIISPGDASALKATAAYEELLRYSPDDFWTMNNLADIYNRAGRAREAWLLQVRMAEVRPESTEQELPYLWSRLVAIGETSSAQRLVALCNSRRDVPQCMEVLITRDSLPIWHAIRLGQLEEAVRLAERIRDQYPGEQAATSPLQSILSEVYEDLGMFQKELEVARNSQDPRTRVRIPVAVAYLRGDTAAENSAMSELAKHPNLTSLGDVMSFAALGRFREAQLVIAAHKNWPAQMIHLARGYVELEKGNITAGLRDLREGDGFYKQLSSDAVCETSDALATALERVGKTDQAIEVLVEAETQLANLSERAFVDPWNLIARLHLARLYRHAGKTAEATAIEAELRAQLRLSEPEHIILRARPQPLSYQAALN